MMRSFLAVSLIVTGCGDNLAGGDGPLGDHTDDQAGVQDDGVVAKLVPEVCAERVWDTVTPDAKDLDLAVVEMPQGAAILGVSRTGGYLQGFLVDGRGLIMGDPYGTKIRTDGLFTKVAANVVDSRLVVSLVENGKTSINVLRDDLEDFRELALLDGDVISDTTLLYARGQRITTTGGTTGLVSSAFDSAWSPMGSEVIARSVPTSMTSTAYGNDAIVAWSTATECHLQRVAANMHSQVGFPCANSRIAMDYDSRAGNMVYEAGDAVMLSNIRVNSHSEIANEIRLVPQGRSPRIAWDGERYWVSYINSHNDIAVGYLTDDNTLVTISIEGTRPEHDAYDLKLINGAMWVFSVDGDVGFGAQKMCLVRE